MEFIKQAIEFVMDILETIVFVGSLFIVVYLFIMQPNQIRGASMEPSFNSGDYIFTSKVTYKFRALERGDVIVFRSPRNPDIEFIKRIIGLPGDKVLFREGEVYVNGQQLKENYIADKTSLWEGGYAKEDEAIVVPSDSLFVLGDNRPRSSDSREFGPIAQTSIIGQVFYRYYPANKIGIVANPLPRALRSSVIPSQLFVHWKEAGV
ncbi:MAG: hypothetical protein RI947_1262 [Candidatus Parcubacteria bacterium]|jgi:signal peptidase I